MGSDETKLRIICPNCGQKIRIGSHLAGKKVCCPVETCRSVIRVPTIEECSVPDAVTVNETPSRTRARDDDIEQTEARPRRNLAQSQPRRQIEDDQDEAEERPRRRPPRPVEDDDDEPEERRPRRRPRPVDEDPPDDLDDDFDEESPLERPRKKKRKKRQRPGEVSPALRYARKRAASILFLIAVVNLVCGGIAVAAGSVANMIGPNVDMTTLVIGVAAFVLCFVGLGTWACFRPFFPALFGLIIYVGDAIYTLATTPALSSFLITFCVIRVLFIITLTKVVITAWNAPTD
jgi:hypothetical protein